MSDKGFRMRVWGSLTEPKTVTLAMVIIYALIAVSAITMLLHSRDIVTEAVPSLLMLVGGVLGVPSAWRGSWWLEGPAAFMCTIGIAFTAALEVVHTLAVIRWPHHTLIMVSVTALFFAMRALRVWPDLYRPGIVPVPGVELARARMQGAQAAERLSASAAN